MLAVGNYGFGEKSTLIRKIFLVPVGLCGFLLLATRKSLPFIKNPAVPQCFGELGLRRKINAYPLELSSSDIAM